MTTKCYAKKRESVRAVQWHGGEKTPELIELLGQRGHFNAETGQLELGSGWYARPSDWILSASGEDLSVISDEVFRQIYEEVDETGRVMPSDDEHEAAGQKFVRELDVLLLAGLKLSREEHPSIFRGRDRLVSMLRHLFEDQAYTAARRERHRIRDKIAKDLTP
jgi:hypothetical protein